MAEKTQGCCDTYDILPSILTLPSSNGISPRTLIKREDWNTETISALKLIINSTVPFISSYKVTPSIMKKWSKTLRGVASLLGNNLIGPSNLPMRWPFLVSGLIRGVTFVGKWPYKRGWPLLVSGLIRGVTFVDKWPYKRRTTVIYDIFLVGSSWSIFSFLCSVL